MGGKSTKIAIVLTAVDKVSAAIYKINRKTKKLFDLGKSSGITGVALAAPLVYATKKAMDFEDSMADVAKVYNTKIGDSVFLQLSDQAKDLSVFLGQSAEETSQLMASLGQGGVEQENLKKVAQTAGKMAVAFDLTAEIAGERYTKLKNALNSSWDETAKLGDAINYLSDNQASKASEILEFMAAGGAGVARMAKAAGQDLAAMGSYLLSVGKSGAESATILERFYKGIMKNQDTRGVFMQAGQGAKGFIAVLEKGASIKDPTAKFKFFRKFGEYGSEIQAIAQNIDQLKASIKSVGDEKAFLGSINREFENRQKTTKGQLGIAMARFNSAVIVFGEKCLPILTKALEAFTPIAEKVTEFMKENPDLTEKILIVTASLSALSLTLSGVSFALGGAIRVLAFLKIAVFSNAGVVGGLKTAFFALRSCLLTSVWPAIVSASSAVWSFTASLLSGLWGAIVSASVGVWGFAVSLLSGLWPAIVSASSAVWSFTVALLSNPITWVVVGIMLLVGAVYLAYKNFDKLRAGFKGVMAVAGLFIEIFQGVGKAIIGAFTFNPKMMMEGINQTRQAINNIGSGGIQKTFSAAYDASIKADQAAKVVQKAAPAKAKASPNVKNSSSTVFAPVINLSGGASKKDGQAINEKIKENFDKMMKEHQTKNQRLAYFQNVTD